jgi:hypothetical protein
MADALPYSLKTVMMDNAGQHWKSEHAKLSRGMGTDTQ